MVNNRILVIDDEAEIRSMFEGILCPVNTDIDISGQHLFEDIPSAPQQESYNVKTASQGPEGYAMVKNAAAEGTPFATAFIDMHMPPGWDGAQTAAKIREIDTDIRIVFVTAYNNKSLEEIYEQVGSTSRIIYLNKPITYSEVRSIAASQTQSYALQKLLEQLAEESNSCKERFLSNMQHELRTPLHHILGFSRLGHNLSQELVKLSKSVEATDLIEYFSHIKKAANSLNGYIEDMCDLSLLEAGEIELVLFESNIISLIEMALANIGVDPDIIDLLQYNKYQDTMNLQCDSKLVVNLFRKLISNAKQYSPQNEKITILVDRDDQSEGPDMLKVTVADRGPGIPEEELAVVFDSFTQSSKTRDGSGGKGVGLPICRQIVDLHNGNLHIENNPDAGITVTVLLPVQQKKR